MKVELELKINKDGRTFLNFWDYAHGDDVACEVIDGKIIHTEYKDEGGDIVTELTLTQFIEAVEASVNNRSV